MGRLRDAATFVAWSFLAAGLAGWARAPSTTAAPASRRPPLLASGGTDGPSPERATTPRTTADARGSGPPGPLGPSVPPLPSAATVHRNLHRRLTQLPALIWPRAAPGRDAPSRCTPPEGAGVVVLRPGAPRVRTALRADLPYNPASTLKVITSAAAVELLGPEFRFTTELRATEDTLFVVGTGDPSLLPGDLHDLLDQAAARVDLSRIRRVVADASAFAPDLHVPGYPRTRGPDAYLAPISALALQFNTVELTRGAGGYAIYPPSAGVEVVDHTGRTGGPPRIRVEPAPAGTTIVVRGRTGPSHARVRVMDPPRYVAGVLALALAHRTGARVPRIATGRVRDDAQKVARHTSAPLVALASASLKYSNNFTAEQILRALGAAYRGAAGTTEAGVDAVRAWWAAVGGPRGALSLENGSGLSHATRVTPRALAAVLHRIADPGSPSHGLLAGLSVAGADGTLAGRLSAQRGRVRGKTGTLAGVSALAGLAAPADGPPFVFVVMQNGVRDLYRARAVQDRFLRCLLARAP